MTERAGDMAGSVRDQGKPFCPPETGRLLPALPSRPGLPACPLWQLIVAVVVHCLSAAQGLDGRAG